jgi:ammonia channel protein AmtB
MILHGPKQASELIYLLHSVLCAGVSFFYGGMVRHKNVVATLMQGIVTLAIIPMVWYFVG